MGKRYGLTQEFAERRKKMIEGGVTYDLYLIFNQNQPTYHGSVRIDFKTKAVVKNIAKVSFFKIKHHVEKFRVRMTYG
jgi:hypothetical protein